jgi:eukaryotic-like serine/threonine-protein kinase
VTLVNGARIGPYQIVSPLGAGGMGEVYRATDTVLKRQVALKVLPPDVAGNPDRVARFQREAEVLASLNHPNIGHLYGIEKNEGVLALVMELVEGPTLADRIAQGPIPLEEVLPIAKQIADAVEAAHEQGIIHRDLKPANIKVRDDGTVKVLDFGLAKAMEAVPTSSSPALLTNSPTLTSPALMTGVGALLGTAAYMSPEQARGKPADKRSDIWAFGCVLYEMLTGRRAFPGDDVAETLAAIVRGEPDWSLLPADASPAVVLFLRRCLVKVPRERLRDIGDMRLALAGAFDAGIAEPVPALRTSWRRRLLGPTTAAVVAAAATLLAARQLWPTAEPHQATRFEYIFPEQPQPVRAQSPFVTISPDGRTIAYQTAGGLYVRSVGELSPPRFVAGSESAAVAPFFSPDGQWVAYIANNGLKKLPIDGGTPTVVSAMPAVSASWAADNTILFAGAEGIWRVPANGGTPALLIRTAEGESMYGPQLLPGGEAVLFSVTTDQSPSRWTRARVVAQVLTSGTRTTLADNGLEARYLPSGHIVYVSGNRLWSMRFDARRLAVSGDATPVLDNVDLPVGVRAAGANYAVADNGTLIYVPNQPRMRSLAWIRRDGAPGPALPAISPARYGDPRLSPDAARALVTRDGDIWIYELASGRSSRVTRDGVSEMGVWNPAGTEVAFSSASAGNEEAWIAPADASAPPRQITHLGGQVHVDSWSPDGRTLAVHHHQGLDTTMFMVPASGEGEPQPFAQGEAEAESAQWSSDGRYVAYVSADSGQREIYVRPYPGPGSRVTVSLDGGREPRWAANGDLTYRSLSGETMFAVTATTAPTLALGTPVPLFRGRFFVAPSGSPRAQYDLTRDGRSFLMLAPASASDALAERPRIIVVQHWFSELGR